MLNRNDNLEVGLKPFASLLDAFRRGNISNKRVNRESLDRHTSELSGSWDQRFPGLPRGDHPYSSFVGIWRRGVRDEFLKNVIIKLLEDKECNDGDMIIVNPVCVSGRHAKDMALRLKNYKVIGTDIDSRLHWLCKHVLRSRSPDNFEFIQDNIFNSKIRVMPAAVVFFGACGSLSDAAMDLAIRTNCPHLICRTCCPDNMGGNTQIARKFSPINHSFRIKNFLYSRIRVKKPGYYFSPDYSIHQYPRSQAAKGLTDPDEFLKIIRQTVESDICRTIIDLDRYLYLAEQGYTVWYKTEMFVAEKCVI
ncbi:MAG: class I SAM-dependent methyltransferase [Phycisphaerae bacterium]|nr:class I SAM-dependent methyltransferase [Phycisphaerae bacterium]